MARVPVKTFLGLTLPSLTILSFFTLEGEADLDVLGGSIVIRTYFPASELVG